MIGNIVIGFIFGASLVMLGVAVGRAIGLDEALANIQKQADRDVERQRILRRIKAGGDQ